VTDDEAFQAALGVDSAGFETEWLSSLGAKAPVRRGPQPAPPGPVPEGWTGAAPNPSVAPGGAAASPTPNSANPGPIGTTGSESAAGPILVALAFAAVLSIVLVLLVMRRRRPSEPPGL